MISRSRRACPGGTHDRLRELHAALGIGVGPVALGVGRRRQHDMGKLRRFGEKNVLHNEEFKLPKRLHHVRDVGIGEHGVLAHDVQRLDLSLEGRGEHLRHRQAGRVGEFNVPRFLELGADVGVGDLLVAGIVVRQGAHVASALDVALAAQRIDAGAGPADLPGDHRQVRKRSDVIDAGRVLGYAHRIDDGRPFRRGVEAGRLLDELGRDPGDLRHPLRRIRGHEFLDCLDPLGAGLR